MAHDSVRELVDSLRSRLQTELDERLNALSARHEQAVAAARQESEAEADRRWSERLADREGAAAKEIARIQSQVVSAQSELTSVRSELSSVQAELSGTRSAASSAQAALTSAFARIDDATSLSALLSAIEAAAKTSVPDAVMLVGPELDRWTRNGSDASTAESDAIRTIARQAMGGAASKVDDRRAAVPLVLDGNAVAVLCAPIPAGQLPATLELIARYGAARLAALTALRTAQARRWLSQTHPAAAAAAASASERKGDTDADSSGEDEVQSARRYARLLVSEIKLYNETAVHEGRAHRDLTRRLGDEIERARRLYEERVPANVADRAQHFHHELVHTLAGGDPSLLG